MNIDIQEITSEMTDLIAIAAAKTAEVSEKELHADMSREDQDQDHSNGHSHDHSSGPSSANDFPFTRTGDLIRQTTVTSNGLDIIEECTAEYAEFVENGHYARDGKTYVAPRPFLYLAQNKLYDQLKNQLQELI